MSRQRALAQLQAEGWGDRVRFFEANTATVALAAQALGCEPAHIAKTLALRSPDGAVLVLAAGDVKLSNTKFREHFGFKAQMIRGEEVEALVGHAPGGVCPFGVNEGVQICLPLWRQRRRADLLRCKPTALRDGLPGLRRRSKRGAFYAAGTV